jgi:alpha-glucosidase
MSRSKSESSGSVFGRLLLFVLLLIGARISATQSGWQPIGVVTSAVSLPNGVELRTREAEIRVEALSGSVIRVHGMRREYPTFEDSFAVVSETGFAAPSVRVKETPSSVEFNTGELHIRVLKSPMRLIFLNSAGQVIAEDAPGRSMAWNGEAFRVWKSMPENEHYFGLGDKAGPIDHRNQAFTMWNTDAFGWMESTDPLYKSVPFFLGLRQGSAYGIFLDNTFRTTFDFGRESPNAYSFGAEGGPLDYYFFYGPNPKKVLEEYTALTGRMPLPPRFALGYQQSRWSYDSEVRVRELAHEFRSKKIPADVIYLDIDYQEENIPFTIDRTRFPNFEAMIHDLGRQGFKVVAITDCHLKKQPGYKPYDEGIAGGYFVKSPDGMVYSGSVWPGESVFPDFARADARKWWGTLYADFVGMGVRGFWNDMNEPAIFDGPGKTMPLDVVHSVEGRRTNHREVHNAYGMENARATYEGLLLLEPDLRPFVLTRAAFAGTQRYAATWTGDNSSTWSHLRLTVPTLLNLGISGFAFAGADIGGFAGNPTPELLTRWMELGAFLPLYRNHAIKGSADREPWGDGPDHEEIRRRFIEARYELLPYIYTSMEDTSRTGIPVMRPMFMEFPKDASLVANSDEYMFGESLLIAPDLQETGKAYKVILPHGTWYDYWTGERIEGGRSFAVKPELNELPVYVRGGAILTLEPATQDTDEMTEGPLKIRVYPGSQCHGSLYADDGQSFAYSRGKYLRINFDCAPEPQSLEVTASAFQGSYKPWWKNQRFEVFGMERPPKNVRIDSQEVRSWSFDAARKELNLTCRADGKGVKLQIDY